MFSSTTGSRLEMVEAVARLRSGIATIEMF